MKSAKELPRCSTVEHGSSPLRGWASSFWWRRHAIQQESQPSAEAAVCASVSAFGTAIQDFRDLDPATASIEDVQAARDDIQAAWDQVKSEATDLTEADEAAVDEAWNGVAQSIDDFPSDEPIEDGSGERPGRGRWRPDRLPGDGRRPRLRSGEPIGTARPAPAPCVSHHMRPLHDGGRPAWTYSGRTSRRFSYVPPVACPPARTGAADAACLGAG